MTLVSCQRSHGLRFEFGTVRFANCSSKSHKIYFSMHLLIALHVAATMCSINLCFFTDAHILMDKGRFKTALHV